MAPARVEDDPVTAEYDVFITPALAEQVYLLQYPIRNREQAYNSRNLAVPTEMRIKPVSGFFEMDIDMSTAANFNKFQSLKWGDAMQKTRAAGGSTFGAAAGFGSTPLQRGPRSGTQRNGETSDEQAMRLDKFNDAVRAGQVFHKQTLGGQVLHDEAGKPNYMLGAFRGKELHLTTVDGIVQMRPQFHHLDAMTHLEKASNQRDADETRPPTQARAVAQTYKDSRDADDSVAQKAKNLMQVAQEESWTRLKYHDEYLPESFEVYRQSLFLQDTEDPAKLKSSMTNEEYLDAISAPRHDPSGRRKKKPLTRKQRAAIELAEDDVELQDDAPAAAA